jgi:hypothetical protein
VASLRLKNLAASLSFKTFSVVNSISLAPFCEIIATYYTQPAMEKIILSAVVISIAAAPNTHAETESVNCGVSEVYRKSKKLTEELIFLTESFPAKAALYRRGAARA